MELTIFHLPTFMCTLTNAAVISKLKCASTKLIIVEFFTELKIVASPLVMPSLAIFTFFGRKVLVHLVP